MAGDFVCEISLDVIWVLEGGTVVTFCRLKGVDRIKAYRESKFQEIDEG
jgi:hypothetical protein